jgi:molybdenum cofactor cytidylyltransferase
MRPIRTFALIPAGGRSTRMGQPKLALPLGDRSVLEHVVAALREARIDQVLVVIGSHLPELVPAIEAAGAATCLLSAPTADMRATVEHGIRWLEEHYRPRAEDSWLLVPADHPTLEADSVRRLLRARDLHPTCSIWIPTFGGQRGHPALMAWRHTAGLEALAPGQGINVYLREHADETAEVSVGSATILCDLDLPEDYEQLRRTWPGPMQHPRRGT